MPNKRERGQNKREGWRSSLNLINGGFKLNREGVGNSKYLLMLVANEKMKRITNEMFTVDAQS